MIFEFVYIKLLYVLTVQYFLFVILYIFPFQPTEAIHSNGHLRSATQNHFPVTATLLVQETSESPTKSRLLNVKRNSMYSIPPPNYHFDPQRSSEKLL